MSRGFFCKNNYIFYCNIKYLILSLSNKILLSNKNKMSKIATKFDEVKEYELSKVITESQYLQSFANKMMELSNRLNEIEDVEEGFIESDDYDIKEDYLPAIREFILNIANM